MVVAETWDYQVGIVDVFAQVLEDGSTQRVRRVEFGRPIEPQKTGLAPVFSKDPDGPVGLVMHDGPGPVVYWDDRRVQTLPTEAGQQSFGQVQYDADSGVWLWLTRDADRSGVTQGHRVHAFHDAVGHRVLGVTRPGDVDSRTVRGGVIAWIEGPDWVLRWGAPPWEEVESWPVPDSVREGYLTTVVDHIGRPWLVGSSSLTGPFGDVSFPAVDGHRSGHTVTSSGDYCVLWTRQDADSHEKRTYRNCVRLPGK